MIRWSFIRNTAHNSIQLWVTHEYCEKPEIIQDLWNDTNHQCHNWATKYQLSTDEWHQQDNVISNTANHPETSTHQVILEQQDTGTHILICHRNDTKCQRYETCRTLEVTYELMLTCVIQVKPTVTFGRDWQSRLGFERPQKPFREQRKPWTRATPLPWYWQAAGPRPGSAHLYLNYWQGRRRCCWTFGRLNDHWKGWERRARDQEQELTWRLSGTGVAAQRNRGQDTRLLRTLRLPLITDSQWQHHRRQRHK